MGQLSGFEIDEHKTLEDEVVEDKVDIKFGCFSADPVLAGNKSESFTQFQEELLQLVDKRLLKIPLQV